MWQRRAIRQGNQFLKHVLPSVIKPLHSLWNEVIGFFFLCFAAAFVVWTVRHFRDAEFSHLLTTGIVGIVLACFGISSFLRARRISRS